MEDLFLIIFFLIIRLRSLKLRHYPIDSVLNKHFLSGCQMVPVYSILTWWKRWEVSPRPVLCVQIIWLIVLPLWTNNLFRIPPPHIITQRVNRFSGSDTECLYLSVTFTVECSQPYRPPRFKDEWPHSYIWMLSHLGVKLW